MSTDLKIAELFSSIQGETSRAGLPCSFVRLSGCNLDCKYCDTVYAKSGGQDFSINEIIAKTDDFGNRLVCITGGEPLLQKQTLVLAEELLERGHEVLIETNGSQPIGGILPAGAVRIMDVKTPGSGEAGSFLISNIEHITERDEIKFVIVDEADFEWVKNFIEEQELAGRCELLASPAFGKLQLQNLARLILDSGLEMRLNLQLHKIIWGDKARGV